MAKRKPGEPKGRPTPKQVRRDQQYSQTGQSYDKLEALYRRGHAIFLRRQEEARRG